jgi:7-cyano-7-deazaguanine synthase
MNPKAVILLSGGLDSSTCLAFAKSKGFDCYALTLNYGQSNIAELESAKRVAAHLGVIEHRILNHPIGQLGGSALTDSNLQVPEFTGASDIPSTYVPARNLNFWSMALGWAEVIGAYDVFTGISAVDYSHYPDCRPEFLAAFQHMANLATKSAVEGQPIHFHAPLIHLSKAQTIQLGTAFGLDYSLTVSCYRASPEGKACGRCDSCHFRNKGFKEAGIADPTRYYHD